ncbi:hypothetical protein [Streptococcus entericus]|uniref:hypothetical protein n=1 Tax=Streptococcus entericus TaxID=155680 RepID=UPI001E5076BE|nr:hypothetical protein [Streptococcus entericus]
MTIITTRQTGGLNRGYKPISPASAYAAFFHFVQASLLLTRHSPLKEVLVLLAIIPKGIFVFFHTQFIKCDVMLIRLLISKLMKKSSTG